MQDYSTGNHCEQVRGCYLAGVDDPGKVVMMLRDITRDRAVRSMVLSL